MSLRTFRALQTPLFRSARLLHTSVEPSAAETDASASATKKVGFIGLGQMGSRMATNLAGKGYQLLVCDASFSHLSDFLKKGLQASPVSSPQELATSPGVEAVITMLPSSSHVKAVYCGPEGLLSAKGGIVPSLLIDTSTIDPITARAVAEEVRKTRLHHDAHVFPDCSVSSPTFVDAPVSGGVTGAAAATLTFMCGGDGPAVAAATPFLLAMGKTVMRLGPPGSGQAAKLCNNLALAIQMAGVAEASSLGVRLGLHPAQLAQVFNSSSARCWSSDSYNPVPGVMEGVPAARDYQGGFAARLMVKDLGLARDAAAAVQAALPMASQALLLYTEVMKKGGEDVDFGAIYRSVASLLPEDLLRVVSNVSDAVACRYQIS